MRKKNNNTEQVLIQKARKGDLLAFSQLVDSYKDVSFSLACSILKDTFWAEDVLQDAFIKVFKQIKRYKGNAKFSTWLFRIVVNTCYTKLKKENRFIPAEDKHCNESISIEGYEKKEKTVLVGKALGFLKTDESLVLKLFYLSDLSVKEIKEVTNFSESKIKVTLHRGRKNLEEVLVKMLGTEVHSLL